MNSERTHNRRLTRTGTFGRTGTRGLTGTRTRTVASGTVAGGSLAYRRTRVKRWWRRTWRRVSARVRTATRAITPLGWFVLAIAIIGISVGLAVGWIEAWFVAVLAALLLLIALWSAGLRGVAAAALLLSILSGAYFLMLQKKVFFGKLNERWSAVTEIGGGIRASELLLTIGTIAVGLGFPLILIFLSRAGLI